MPVEPRGHHASRNCVAPIMTATNATAHQHSCIELDADDTQILSTQRSVTTAPL